ncbi:uncharacterized protein LOC141728480 [Zonotrichia albicollis]|uniref:uncharacterized protein LOC141728480 n=1 Tax=Zonotrichia albicollis TaxID=44394 RepID=UPI003D80E102
MGPCRCMGGRLWWPRPGPERCRSGAALARPGELPGRTGDLARPGRPRAAVAEPRRCEPREPRRAGQGRQRRRGRCCGGPGGAGRSVRSGRGARAPPPPPGPVPAPPGRGSGRGSPGRRRPRVPEEPPEEPLSWREPRSVRGRQRARPSAARSAGAVPRFGGAFSALIASLCSVCSGRTLRAAVFFLSGAGGDDKGIFRAGPNCSEEAKSRVLPNRGDLSRRAECSRKQPSLHQEPRIADWNR